MVGSVLGQSWAATRRFLITIIRSPISSFLGMVLSPGILLGLVIYLVIRTADQENVFEVQQENFISLVLFMTTSYQFYRLGSMLIADKETGFKSLMMTMGLRRISYYISSTVIILCSILPVVIAVTVTTMIYLFKDSEDGKFNLILLFMLFAIQLTAYAHFWSSLIYKASLASLLLIPLILDLFIHTGVCYWLKNTSESLYPHVLFLSSVSPYESIKIYCNSYLMCKNCGGSPKFDKERQLVSEPSYQLYIGMTFWTVLLYLFSYLINEVLPYCSWQISLMGSSSSSVRENIVNPNYFEPLSSNNREIGIEVKKLTKTYNKIPVVNNLSFRVYKGETTLLLGHNGAGKTTLMNMMLKQVTPDQGEVNLISRRSRSAIGLCPQNSILDDNLTVSEHLELFCSIKSSDMNGDERISHIKKTLEDVGLTSHAGKVPGKLSGGMKRKLSLGMAFVGQSSILILDEPSSGLDPDSRVFVWDAIRRYRGDRTVLLSTQHMEEADYLGDRIAIMSAGSIICCGSSIFLNDIFGSGYKLRIECDASTKQDVLKFIKDYFEAAKTVGEDGMAQSRKDATVDFVVELSGDKSQDLEAKLIAMLEKLEEDTSRYLKIKSYGLRSSSIEDVMLKTGRSPQLSGETVQVAMSTEEGNLLNLTNTLKTETGSGPLLSALLVKHWQVYVSQWKSIVFFRILLPIFCLWDKIYLLESMPTFAVDIITACMILHYIQFPIVERFTGFKTVQLASKASLKLYWLSFIITDSLSFLFNIIVINIILLTSLTGTIIGSPIMVHLISSAAVLMYSLSGALMAYVLSSSLSQMDNAIGLYIMFFFSSILASVIITVLILVAKVTMSWKKTVDLIFISFLPSDAFQYVLFGLKDDCYIRSYAQQECQPTNSFFSTVVIGFLALAGQILVYGLLLFLIETKRINPTGLFTNPFKKTESKPINLNRQPDQDVVTESTKAARLIEKVPDSNFSLVVSNLSKSYVRGVKVIDKLSFTVEKGECFGLLGVNGAGKSTTFSMVVAENRPDSGRICLNGYYNTTDDADQYRSTLGYDPQPNPDIALTPIQALTLMARLRQVEEQSIARLVESLLEVLNMMEHGNKLISDLSGGTKRKLGLGMSLIGNPLLFALDEPTAGVDPLARRGIWRLLRQLRTQSGASILISSHAMEECEAICDRISIMSRGNLRCIGTFLHLRNKFSQGCSIRVQFIRKRKDKSLEPLSLSQKNNLVTSLSEHLQTTVGHQTVKLADSNVNSATFNITNDRVPRSQLFKILREFRKKHPSISYALNDSSLEDIFLKMAKEEQQEPEDV